MTERKGEWTLIGLEAEDGQRIYRIRAEPPAGVKKEVFSESVIIEWKFGAGLPDKPTAAAMFAFEEYMEPVNDHTKHSLLVLVYTGSGMKEWCYYTKSYDEFMKGLNVALRGKPRFPIAILHDHDPTWNYWSSLKDYAHGTSRTTPTAMADGDEDSVMSQWQPHREPLRSTLMRTGAIALVGGGALAQWWGGLARWPMAFLLLLWPAFGGHWVELWFLNWLRPRLPVSRAAQVGARIAVWFVGGSVLALGMGLTAMALAGFARTRWPPWWLGGLGFIGLELVVHLALQLRGRRSFYNGRG